MADQVEESLTDRKVIVCFNSGLKFGPLIYELSAREPQSKAELYKVAYAISMAEDKTKKRGADKTEAEATGTRHNDNGNGKGSKGKNRTRSTEKLEFTPLTKPISEIMQLVKLPPPRPLTDKPKFPRNMSKYCDFHKDHGHTTDGCWALKKIIQQWVDEGKLDRYIMKKDGKRKRKQEESEDDSKSEDEDRRPPRAKLHVIREEVTSTRKLRDQIHELSKVYHVPAWIHKAEEVISFSPNELAGSRAAREQPLVIKGRIDNVESERLLVDTGASRDILYYSAFQQMGLKDTMLEPYHGRLEGFTNHKVGAKGTVELELEIGDHPYRSKATVNFVVMDLTSDYHAIIGIPSQAKLGSLPPFLTNELSFPLAQESVV